MIDANAVLGRAVDGGCVGVFRVRGAGAAR